MESSILQRYNIPIPTTNYFSYNKPCTTKTDYTLGSFKDPNLSKFNLHKQIMYFLLYKEILKCHLIAMGNHKSITTINILINLDINLYVYMYMCK